MFDRISTEIAEREEFLAEMKTAGRGDQYERQIKGEIGIRVGQLRKLDIQIKEREGKAGI